VLYKGEGEVIEFRFRGEPIEQSVNKYLGKRVVILRPRQLTALCRSWLKASLTEYPKDVRFDWLGVICEVFGLPRVRMNKRVRCDEFVQMIYDRAGLYFDFWQIMHRKFEGPGIPACCVNGSGDTYLAKVFDYREVK